MAVERFLDYLAENPRWIAFGLAGYTTLYLISRMLSGPRAGRNPFATDSRKPREPLVTDPHARDAVLKQSKCSWIVYIYQNVFVVIGNYRCIVLLECMLSTTNASTIRIYYYSVGAIYDVSIIRMHYYKCCLCICKLLTVF